MSFFLVAYHFLIVVSDGFVGVFFAQPFFVVEMSVYYRTEIAHIQHGKSPSSH